MSRGSDGTPVNVLFIDGTISDNRAEGLENLLWDLLPAAGRLRAPAGHFDNQHGSDAVSHPLALTQLLITWHMVKAAVGAYAIL